MYSAFGFAAHVADFFARLARRRVPLVLSTARRVIDHVAAGRRERRRGRGLGSDLRSARRCVVGQCQLHRIRTGEAGRQDTARRGSHRDASEVGVAARRESARAASANRCGLRRQHRRFRAVDNRSWPGAVIVIFDRAAGVVGVGGHPVVNQVSADAAGLPSIDMKLVSAAPRYVDAVGQARTAIPDNRMSSEGQCLVQLNEIGAGRFACFAFEVDSGQLLTKAVG